MRTTGLQAVVALVRRDRPISSVRDTIGWWEVRRVPYNLVVGTAGIITSGTFVVVALVSEMLGGEPVGLPDPAVLAIFPVVVYAIMANVCYTGGWVAELVVRQAWPELADRFATLTFATGLVFSLALTLVPAFLFVVALAIGGMLQLVFSGLD